MTKKKTNAEFLKQVDELTKTEYIFLTKYIDSKTKITCRHNKCGNVWEISPDNFLRGKRCPDCQNRQNIENRRNDLDKVKEIVIEKGCGDFVYVSGYKNSKSKVKLRHLKCGQIITKPFSTIYCGISCDCEKTDRNIVDFKSIGNRIQCRADFQRFINKYTQGEYVIIGRYRKSTEPILLKHTKCGNLTKISPHNFKNGARCDKCKNYKGELKIRNLLLKRGVFFEEQVRFSDCRLKKPLVFDFYLPIHNILIEFDGEQHDRPVKYWGGEQQFKLQQIRDRVKNRYCRKKSITLIRIKYFEDVEQKLERFL